MKALLTYILIFFFLMGVNKPTKSQEKSKISKIRDIIESIAEEKEEDFDYSYLVEELNALAENPVNINNPDKLGELANLQLINDIQINNLRSYIKSFGELKSIYELQYVYGFNRKLAQQLEPFIRFDDQAKTDKLTPSKMLKDGRNELILRYQRVLEKAKGYHPPPDSEWIANPGSAYLGNPDKYYLKYKFDYKRKLRFGFVAEKDPGEYFLFDKVPDSIKLLADGKLKKGFDFYSAYGYYENEGFLRKLVVGDFHPSFGQGLTLWSGFSMGKSSQAVNIKKYANGLRPNTSVNENLFMRGLGTEIAWKSFSLSLFYSKNKIDGNMTVWDSSAQQVIEVSSLQETGYHRTLNELLDKNRVECKVLGGNINFRSNAFQIGFTAFKSLFSAAVNPDSAAYRLFEFRGKENLNLGVDFDIMIKRLNIFGELSRSKNGGMAGIIGLTAPLQSRIDLALIYRKYEKDYQNLYSLAFAEGSSNANEEGFYVGLQSDLSRYLSVSAYADLFKFPWLRFRLDKPTFGKEYFFQLSWEEDDLDIYFRYKYKEKGLNNSEFPAYLTPVNNYKKQNFRLHVNYQLGDQWHFANRCEIVLYDFADEKHQGYLVFQDIAYFTKNSDFDIHVRYALFDAADYDARIYAYENDVLYAFSIPAYYGKGSRIYALLDYKFSRNMELWFRYAISFFTDRDVISSGLNEIEGNKKSEVKLQLRIKF